MILVWGSRLYGRTDEIPKLGYVATNFGHMWYIPLIPTQTSFIIHQSSEGWQGVPIRMSGKSILLAWMRCGLVVAICISSIVAMSAFMDARPSWTLAGGSITVTVLCAAAWLFSKKSKAFAHASYERAIQIADEVGFSEEARIVIDLAYEQISRQEADRRLDALDEDGEDVFAEQDGIQTIPND